MPCSAQLVIDASLPRCGTTSLSNLLKSRGYVTHHNLGKAYRHEEYRAALLSDVNATSTNHSFIARFLNRREPSAFSDIPMHLIACMLSRQHPHALFVLKTRDATAWVDSFAYMLCRFTASELCGYPARPTNFNALDFHAWAYGASFMSAFCGYNDELCSHNAEREAAAAEASSPLWAPLRAQLLALYHAHHAQMLRCLPPTRRLIYSLDAGDEAAAHALTRHLNCTPPIRAAALRAARNPRQELSHQPSRAAKAAVLERHANANLRHASNYDLRGTP